MSYHFSKLSKILISFRCHNKNLKIYEGGTKDPLEFHPNDENVSIESMDDIFENEVDNITDSEDNISSEETEINPNDSKKYSCTDCDITFNQPDPLKLHMNCIHDEQCNNDNVEKNIDPEEGGMEYSKIPGFQNSLMYQSIDGYIYTREKIKRAIIFVR